MPASPWLDLPPGPSPTLPWASHRALGCGRATPPVGFQNGPRQHQDGPEAILGRPKARPRRLKMFEGVSKVFQFCTKGVSPTPPSHWHSANNGKGYRRPVCKLDKAPYGHPESGGHWEAHLTRAIRACGGVPVTNHPSSFWMEGPRLLLTVYVDDLLLSGPTEKHDQFWSALREVPVVLEDPEPLDRFLGRNHVRQ